MLIGYCRISTQDQDMQLQRDALRHAGCDRVFEETASGAQRDRPQLAAALAYVRPGDVLVVWRLDRLARSLRQLIDTVAQLEGRQAHMRSLTEHMDTSTNNGRLVFHMFGALAEFERGLIRERTLAGLASARARGRTGGRPKALTEAKLKAVRAMLAAGDLTVAEIADQMGVSVGTLYRAIPAARAMGGHVTTEHST